MYSFMAWEDFHLDTVRFLWVHRWVLQEYTHAVKSNKK